MATLSLVMSIQFATPLWFWALLGLIPLFGLRLWSHIRSGKNLPGLVSPRLRTRLISGSNQVQHWLSFVFLALALASLIVAMARPQWGFEETATESEARNLIIAIDTSRSMLATDLLPNRMARAKLAAQDIINSLPDDRIGVIAFAGKAFLQAPLTVDHYAVIESIEQLDTEIIPRGGTNLSEAVKLALATFKEAEVGRSALVIFSDGESLEGLDQITDLKKSASESAMAIVTIGVGSESGAIIPQYDRSGKIIPGKFVMDDQGQVVRSRLDSSTLQSLASGGGVYVHLGGNASLSRVVERITGMIEASRNEEEARMRPIERFMWPLGVAFASMICSYLVPLFFFRSGRRFAPAPAIAILCASLFPPANASASDGHWDGFDAFKKGDYKKAIQSYESELLRKPSSEDAARLRFGLGSAAYRQGDFERASEEFGQALTNSDPELQEQAHYNLGNTLFRKGEAVLQNKERDPDTPQSPTAGKESIKATIQQWESAIEHYQSALGINQENANAAHNIDIVKARIEQLKEEQRKQEKQEQEKKEQEEKEKKEQDKKKDKKEEKNEDQKKDEQDSDSEQKKDQENNEKEDKGNPDNKRGDQDKQDENKDGEKNKDEKNDQPEPEPEKDEPKDGELKADTDEQDSQKKEQEQKERQQREADAQQNPETGYSPSEARQLLKSLADETEVRPILRPAKAEKYKNW